MAAGHLIQANAWGGAWGYSWWGAWGNAWGGWTAEIPLEYYGGGGVRRRAPSTYRGRRLEDPGLEDTVRSQWELLDARLRSRDDIAVRSAPAKGRALAAATAAPSTALASPGLNSREPDISAPAAEDGYDALALLLLST